MLDDVALPEGLRNLRRIRKILGDTLQAAGNSNLLFLLAIAAQLGDIRNRAQLVFNALDVILQLTVSITTSVDGRKHRYGVAKIGIHDQSGNPWWKLASSVSLIEVVAQFGPEFIRVAYAVLQLHVYKKNSGAAGGIGLLLANFREFEEMILEFFGQLALDLIGGCSRIEYRYNAGPNGDAGVLHARHVEDRLRTGQQKP